MSFREWESTVTFRIFGFVERRGRGTILLSAHLERVEYGTRLLLYQMSLNLCTLGQIMIMLGIHFTLIFI